jgi:hypothetical protein
VERGEDWLRFRPIHPVQENPIILRHLLDHQLQVISFQEVPRSLEQVYLKVVNQTAQEESRAFNLG